MSLRGSTEGGDEAILSNIKITSSGNRRTRYAVIENQANN